MTATAERERKDAEHIITTAFKGYLMFICSLLILVSYFYTYYYNHDLVCQKSIRPYQVLSDTQYCCLARYHTLGRPNFCWYVPPPFSDLY
jgi:hypothetical protein